MFIKWFCLLIGLEIFAWAIIPDGLFVFFSLALIIGLQIIFHETISKGANYFICSIYEFFTNKKCNIDIDAIFVVTIALSILLMAFSFMFGVISCFEYPNIVEMINKNVAIVGDKKIIYFLGSFKQVYLVPYCKYFLCPFLGLTALTAWYIAEKTTIVAKD